MWSSTQIMYNFRKCQPKSAIEKMKIDLKSPGFIVLCFIAGLPLMFSLLPSTSNQKSRSMPDKSPEEEKSKGSGTVLPTVESAVQPTALTSQTSSKSIKTNPINGLPSPSIPSPMAASTSVPSPSVIKIGESCERYMIDSSSDDPKVRSQTFNENYIRLCRSVDEFVAAGIRYSKAFKNANSQTLKSRALHVCQDYKVFRDEPICTEILATPGLAKDYYLAVDELDYETPVPVTINSVPTMIVSGYSVKILGKKGNSVKVNLSGPDIDGNDVSEKTAWVELKFVKTNLTLP